MTDSLDPVRFELFKNAIFAIADEMALTIVRTSYSGVIKDNMDFSTAFCDADGQLVAQGLTLPGHLGSVPTALAAVVARYGDAMKPGDIFSERPDLFATVGEVYSVKRNVLARLGHSAELRRLVTEPV